MSRNQNAYLKDENLLTLFSLNNLIVPEIQREYVWGNNTEVLESFLKELEKKAAPCETCHYAHTDKNVNVGFLYSYKPSYLSYERERVLDEFLIDGQQRITTLFLLLLYRATIENRLNDFTSICRADEGEIGMGFNYKVRNLTKQFIIQLVEHAKEGVDAFDFVDNLDNSPYWFLGDYKNDPTVISMIGALKSIKKVFGNKENQYFDFLLTNIRFWHFKTEATSQGEELYITMNSRGEQLADNEMQKSRVLPTDKLLDYGKKWEEWQTFFWRNRKKSNSQNQNADKGFNNYLSCIEGIERFYGDTNIDKQIEVSVIESYMNALMKICSSEFKKTIEDNYKGFYTGWYDNFIFVIWDELNNNNTNWNIIDPRKGSQEDRKLYNNQSGERNKSMIFWSWMYYFKNGDNDDSLLIRLIHFYYIRYNCYKRSTTTIDKVVSAFMQNNGKIHEYKEGTDEDNDEDDGNNRLFSEEEITLSRFYYSEQGKKNEIEACIWEIQDQPYFLKGRDLGGNTINDYLEEELSIFQRTNVLESAKEFKKNIEKIFEECEKSPIIKQLLLFYGVYWKQQSPGYYYNYETSDWKRIVRTPQFIKLYKDLTDNKIVELDPFLNEKREKFFKENNTINRKGEIWPHQKLCILYDVLSVNGIWDDKHINVVFWKNEKPSDDTEVFVGQNTLWKANRYYDGSARIQLKANWKELLNKDYGVTVKENPEDEQNNE